LKCADCTQTTQAQTMVVAGFTGAIPGEWSAAMLAKW
jgi:hypothetical protein